LCVGLGGTITGEHGVGIEKINSMCVQFAPEEREVFFGVKRASIPSACSIPARRSRRWRAAPSTERCTCIAARCRLPTSRDSRGAMEPVSRAVHHPRRARSQDAGAPARIRQQGFLRRKPYRRDHRHACACRHVTPSRRNRITARCGTTLAEIERTLAQHGQFLAFEPPAFSGDPTIGGSIAAGLSGPRRASAGAARDFVLGASLLNARGQ
jgi:hypothetical protein